MKGLDGFVQAYNTQIAVEPMLQLIVEESVTQQENDQKQLLPMIGTVQEQAVKSRARCWPTTDTAPSTT